MEKSQLIRVEASAYLEQAKPSGIGQYTRNLVEALNATDSVSVELTTGPFFVGPVGTKPSALQTFANKTYRKLCSFLPISWQPAYDRLMKPSDLTIFPNFSTLRCSGATRVAAVIHDTVYIDHPETVESRNLKFLKRVVPRSASTADFIVTTSEYVKGRIKSTLQVRGQIITIPIPPDSGFYSPPHFGRAELLRKFQIPDGDYLLFIGNFEPRKNIGVLVKAYKQLPQSVGGSLSLLLAGGSGWRSEEVVKQISDAKKQGYNIFTLGYVTSQESYDLKRHAFASIVPSFYEGYGMQILESMAARTPVIASNITVFREVAGDAATFFDPHSEEELAHAILLLREQVMRYKQLVRDGYKRSRALTWKQLASEYLTLIG